MKRITVGFLGLGNIGGGVAELLAKNGGMMMKEYGVEFVVKKALVRSLDKKHSEYIDKSILTLDANDILSDPEITLVAEFMGGVEPATEYLVRALESGKTVVTANKNAVATSWEKLWSAAEKGGSALYFEAAAAGAVPIVAVLNDSMQANDVTRVMGIVNGTTNYILSRMRDEKLPYEEVLKDAQRLGYAEPDPTFDVDGTDAAYKLSILSSLAFKKRVPMDCIKKRGITDITAADIELGAQLGMTLKLLAIGKKTAVNGKTMLEEHVYPTFVSDKHPLAGVKDAFNAVYVTGNMMGDCMLYGRGAGPLPTASAIVSDMVRSATYGFKYPEFVKSAADDIEFTEGEGGAYFVRFAECDIDTARKAFEKCGIGVADAAANASGAALIALDTTEDGIAKVAAGLPIRSVIHAEL